MGPKCRKCTYRKKKEPRWVCWCGKWLSRFFGRKQGSLYRRLSVNVCWMSILVVRMIWSKVTLTGWCATTPPSFCQAVPVRGCCEVKPHSSWFPIVLAKRMAIPAVVWEVLAKHLCVFVYFLFMSRPWYIPEYCTGSCSVQSQAWGELWSDREQTVPRGTCWRKVCFYEWFFHVND